jgi:hypothetical protein
MAAWERIGLLVDRRPARRRAEKSQPVLVVHLDIDDGQTTSTWRS